MAHRVNNDSDSSHSPAASILLKLIEDYHSFNPSREVPVLPYPTPLEFSKQVGRGRPCVYRLDPNDQPPPTRNDEIDEDEEDEKVRNRLTKDEMKNILSCSAFSWTRQSMCEKVKEDVEVAVTPDGRADSLYRLPRPQSRRGFYNEEKDEDEDEDEEAEEVFVQPATIKMSLSTLFDKLLIPQDDDEEEDDDEYEEESTTTTTTSIGTNSTNVNRRRHEKRQKDTKQYYLQSQNSNLTTTSSSLSPLLEDLPRRHLPFAGPVLGQPEAVNIWIGGSGSVTSTHRDPYENLYLVLKGCKTFTLYPPVEELCLHAKRVRTGRHVLVDSGDNKQEKEEEFEIVLDDDIQQQEQEKSTPETETDTDTDTEYDNKIPWIPIDPDTINFSSSDTSAKTKYHYYKYSNPIKVKVWENEILYLPSGWFHHVRQECGVWDDDGQIAPCIAVNYWYDMDYEGEKYATREMMTRLVETVRREEQR